MFQRLDDYLMRQLTRFVAWAWDVHGVSKLQIMRPIGVIGMALVFCGKWRMGEYFSACMIVALFVIVYGIVESLNGKPVSRGALNRWFSLLAAYLNLAFSSHIISVGTVLGALWVWLAFVESPKRPPRIKRKEKSAAKSALLPSPI